MRLAQHSDRGQLAKLRALLWPDASSEEHLNELDQFLLKGTNGTLPIAIFVSENEKDNKLSGFFEVGIRSHADGCNPARPVAFIEGWFVEESSRHRGVGRALMRAAEDWARAQGCLEMASDALIENDASCRAHESMGFEVVDRCVHFRKSL